MPNEGGLLGLARPPLNFPRMMHQAGKPLDLVDTEYSACSVATRPLGDRSLVATGLYQIVKDDSADGTQDASAPATKRLGRCLLSRIDGQGKLREVQRIETAAILDMAWSNETNSSTLALADSVGQISLYDYTDVDNGRDGQLVQRQVLQIADPSLLVLSLDWDNRRSKSTGSIVASISDGTTAVLRGETQLEVEQTWHAHDYEPWIAAWDYWDTQSVWTGGDDCKLKLWDLRTGTTFPSAVKKDFSAGVTTTQSHPLAENIFAVGSYDATLRLFDRRNIKQPLVEHDVGGGIWRVRWHPTDPDKLLLACMHDGFKVIAAEDGFSRCVTTTRFDEHGKDALAYGVDWCGLAESPGRGATSESYPAAEIVASCSFYDHQLRSWSVAV